MRRAFSYSRFSSAEQANGRSLVRQQEAAKSYCQRHGLTLDERTYTDLGVSAYHGANATHGALADFLEAVKERRVPKGSVLIVENTDRLTRLTPDAASALITSIVRAGIDVVTLSPEQRYTADNIHTVGVWVPLQVAIALAAEESRKKGERVADAWQAKRDGAAAKKLSRRGPAWLRLNDDRTGWTIVEDKAAAVRRAFELCVEGVGVHRITGILNREHPLGLTGKGWHHGALGILMRSRSIIGEYQPHVGCPGKRGRKSTRRPSGDPVKGYFPAVMSEADFYLAQAALDGRCKGGGHAVGFQNTFNGILYDGRPALDGRTHRMVVSRTKAGGVRILVSAGAVRKIEGCAYLTVPYDGFERTVLRRLAELTPADVLVKASASQDRLAALSGKLTACNKNIETVKERITGGEDIAVFLDLLRDLDRRRKAITDEMEEARADAASQEGDAVGDLVTLAGLLDATGPDERDALRVKIRNALRRVAERMLVLVVQPRRRSAHKAVAVQVCFRSGKVRHYLMLAGPVGPGEDWPVLSFAEAGAEDGLDLRDADHVRRLEAFLAAMPLA